MRTLRVLLLVIFALILVGLACSTSNRVDWEKGLYSEHTLRHEGRERTFLVILPEMEPGQPYPLILALHGGGGTARSMCAMPGGLAEPARRAGFILVCPQGFDRHWNDGRDIQTWRAHAEQVDDVGFLTTLIETLSLDYELDLQNVFATGISNGGQMSYRLACEEAGTLRAIAPVVASMATSLHCAPIKPVSVLVINGTEDPLVPYEGGEIRAIRRGLGTVHSTDYVLQFWAAHNQCDLEPDKFAEPDTHPGDGTRIWRHAFANCQSNAKVMLYEVVGGGHTWPGANQYLPEFLIGRLSEDIDASEVILSFFQSVSSGE